MFRRYKILICLITFCTSFNAANSQTTETKRIEVYNIKPVIDFPAAGALVAGTLITYPLRTKKDTLNYAQALTYTPDKLSKFNRHAAKQFDLNANKVSDYIFYSGFGVPFLLFLNKPIRKDAGKISLLYLETLGTLGLLDGLAAGTVNKFRPYVYNPDVPIHYKISSNANGSFFGSHPAFTAACTFFAAKVYNYYHPNRSSRYLVWAGAGAVTLASSYFRYKGGEHFVGDIAFGVCIGTLTGILIPEIHRIKNKKKVSSINDSR